MTLPSALSPLLMVTPSAKVCPEVPVSLARSLPVPAQVSLRHNQQHEGRLAVAQLPQPVTSSLFTS